MTIDPRLAERRREVAEDRAKKNVRRLLKFLALIGVLGGLVWFALSPWMSVSRVHIAGVSASATEQILIDQGVIAGTPMVLLRTGDVIEAIEADPWVSEAEVRLRWPNDVVVRVTERVPRAWVQTSDGWVRRDADGVAVPSRTSPDNTLGWVKLPDHDADGADELIRGSIGFLSSLPHVLAVETAIRLEAGELWAVVHGFSVRLGRPIEMAEKARALTVLLEQDLPANAVLILVAPTNPAYSVPFQRSEDDEAGEDSEDVDTEGDAGEEPIIEDEEDETDDSDNP